MRKTYRYDDGLKIAVPLDGDLTPYPDTFGALEEYERFTAPGGGEFEKRTHLSIGNAVRLDADTAPRNFSPEQPVKKLEG